jgi:hypothetical protein
MSSDEDRCLTMADELEPGAPRILVWYRRAAGGP